MQPTIALGIFLMLFSLPPQKSFNMGCYQQYKECMKQGELAATPCRMELCSYEQCICQEIITSNPVTGMEDTDPGAWGSAITTCSPMGQAISECIQKQNAGAGRSADRPALKVRLQRILGKLRSLRRRCKTAHSPGRGQQKSLSEIDKQIHWIKKSLKAIEAPPAS